MKNFKLAIPMLLIVSMLWGVSGCGMFEQVKEVTPEEFKEAAYEVYNIDDSEISEDWINVCVFRKTFTTIEPIQGCFIQLTIDNPSECEDSCGVSIKSRIENMYNDPFPFEDEYDINEIRSNYNEDNCYVILTTSDEQFIERQSSNLDYPDNYDSILYAEYYSGSMMIEITCMYDSSNPDDVLEDVFEFIDYLDLPSL